MVSCMLQHVYVFHFLSSSSKQFIVFIHSLIDVYLTCIVDFLSAINFSSLAIDVQDSI